MTLLILLLSVAIIFLINTQAFAAGRVSATREVELTPEIESISIRGYNGSIQWNPVLPGEKPRVVMKKQIFGFLHDTMMNYLNDLEVEEHSTANGLDIEIRKLRKPFGVISSQVSLTLYASPEQIKKFAARVSNGAITINASFECPLILDTSNGSITLRSGVGSLRLGSSNGKIDLGNVKLAGSSQVITSNGSIGGWVGLEEQGEYIFETSNGRIDLAFPSETKGTFHLSTSNGRVNFALGNQVSNGKWAVIELGEGPTVKIRTSNGSIDVRGN